MFTRVQPGIADGKPSAPAKAPMHKPNTPPAKGAAPGKHEPAKPGANHKAEIDKMNPEHLHNLVKAAHSGKFGPEAQKHAQQAMQAAPQGAAPQGEPEEQGGPDYAGMFGAPGAAPQGAPQDDDQPVSAGSMFGGR
jgi:hypothetical protein